jgi:hydrogenase/urease accessory protein HupE
MSSPLKKLIVRWCAALIGACIGVISLASGHEVRPSVLQITERPSCHYYVFWKQPSMGLMTVHLVPHISGGLLEGAPSSIETASNFQIRLWRDLDPTDRGLEGRTLQIEGLSQTITDVLVSIALADGSSAQQILHRQDPSLTLHLHKTGMAVPAYLTLGIEHILTGIDHLSFVLGLMLLVRRRMTLIKTITAFTVAHSITLAATALHVLTVRPAVIEALVALSILFVAVELVHSHRGRNGLTVRYPWMIAFTFGLLHGSAFAGALAEIGLPPHAIPLSLLLFNVGVELGQLMFIVAVLSLGWALRQLPREMPAWTRWVPPYAVGSFAAFWFIERLHTAVS